VLGAVALVVRRYWVEPGEDFTMRR
jgi:hypothetical protein